MLQSLEAGRWLDEEPYEQHDFFPAAQLSRLEKLACTDGAYKQDIFSESGPIFVSEQTAPPHRHLVKLIEFCGGQVR